MVEQIQLPFHENHSFCFLLLSPTFGFLPPCFACFLAFFIPIPLNLVFFLFFHMSSLSILSSFISFYLKNSSLVINPPFCFVFLFHLIPPCDFFHFFFYPHPLIFPLFSSCLFFLPLLSLANIFPSFLIFPFFFHSSSFSFYFVLPLFLLSLHAFPLMPFWATEKIWLPLDSAGVSDGDQKNLVAIQHAPNDEWWLKNFDHHLTHHTIEWCMKFFIHPRGKVGDDFFFPKMIAHPPSLSIAIQWWGYVGHQLKKFSHQKSKGVACNHFWKKIISPPHPCPLWWLKKFSHHPMVGCVGWQLKKLDCHLTHPHYLMVTESFRSPRKGRCVICFWEALDEGLLRAFQKHKTCPLFVVIEKFQSP